MTIIFGSLPFIIMVIVTLCEKSKLDVSQRKHYSNGAGNGILIGMFLVLSVVVIISTVAEPTPTALDVYRNKTELEITYKNTTPIDSTVIWRKN